MEYKYFLQKSIFILRFRILKRIKSFFIKRFLVLLGMKIGKGTFIPNTLITWPNQVSIGSYCYIEQGVYFKFSGSWRNGKSINIGNNVFIGSNSEFNITDGITIGNDTLIASGCRFVDHDHGTALNELMRKQEQTESKIVVGSNVWIGFNAVVLKGVTIGNGAIVAAGAVVTKSVPALEIWGGIPAAKIGTRNETKVSFEEITAPHYV